MTIKMIAPICSAAGVSKAHFHDHWRHPHGTWARGMLRAISYVQSHRIDTPHLGFGQNAMDGVTEVGFDNVEDAAGLGEDPIYLEYLQPDEPSFIDANLHSFSFMDEEVVQSGLRPGSANQRDGRPWIEFEQPVSIKLIQIVTAGRAAAWQADDDAELAEAVGALRHVRSTPNPVLHPQLGKGSIIGMRQLWWPTYSNFEVGVSGNRAAWRRLIERDANIYAGVFQAERFF